MNIRLTVDQHMIGLSGGDKAGSRWLGEYSKRHEFGWRWLGHIMWFDASVVEHPIREFQDAGGVVSD